MPRGIISQVFAAAGRAAENSRSVAPAEKEKLSENAYYCGLSLSEYLRRLGLGKDVKAATDEKIYKTFRLIRQLKKVFDLLERSEILHRLSVIEDLLK